VHEHETNCQKKKKQQERSTQKTKTQQLETLQSAIQVSVSVYPSFHILIDRCVTRKLSFLMC